MRRVLGRACWVLCGTLAAVAPLFSEIPAAASGVIGSVGSWATSSHHVPTSLSGAASVTYNGYAYLIGGSSSTGGTWLNTIYYAKLNTDGTTSAWSTNATTLPQGSYYPSAAVSNGYVYVMGGYGGSFQTSVYYAKINTDGSIGSWSTSPHALPQGLYEAGAVSQNGYIYVIGGLNSSSSALDTTYYAKQNSDGSIGTWSTSSNHLPQGVDDAAIALANGRVYVLGGSGNSSFLQTAYSTSFNTDGSIGSWSTSATTLPQTLDGATASAANGYLYLAGGDNGIGTQAGVYYTKLASDGSIGAWTTSTNSLPQPLQYADAMIYEGNLYVMTGQNSGLTQDTVYSAPLNFVSQSSITNPVTNQTVSLATPLGTNITAFSQAASTAPDNGYSYPLGLTHFSFTTDNLTNQITITLQTSLQPNQVIARKYNDTTKTYSAIPGATIASTTLNGQPALGITYTITDGGSLDEDGTVNGSITDPIGLAVANSPAVTAPNTGYGQPPSSIPLVIAGGSTIVLALGSALLMPIVKKRQKTPA